MENNRLPLTEFVITKGLAKGPEEYSDGKAQAHVQVALKMKASRASLCGRATTCRTLSSVRTPTVSVALRSARYDPAAVEKAATAGKLALDKKWYLESQVHPVVCRICAVIEGTDSGQLADCLGLESCKFHKNDHQVPLIARIHPFPAASCPRAALHCTLRCSRHGTGIVIAGEHHTHFSICAASGGVRPFCQRREALGHVQRHANARV